MAFDPPASPIEGQTYEPAGGPKYIWHSPAWELLDIDTGTGGGSSDWADITNKPPTFPPTLPIAQTGVTNLVSDLALKAPLASPVFTGDPKAPTPTVGDNDTSLATTAFVATAVANHIVNWSELTGKPTTFPPTVPIASADVTGLDTKQASQDAAIAAINWSTLTGKPSTFPPTLPIASSGVTGLDAKQTAQDNAIAAINWSTLTGKPSSFPAQLPIPSSGVSGLDTKQADQDAAIAAISWTTLSGKPSTFPPQVPIASADVIGLDTAQANQDAAINGKVAKAGDTMTGNLEMVGGYIQIKKPGANPSLMLDYGAGFSGHISVANTGAVRWTEVFDDTAYQVRRYPADAAALSIDRVTGNISVEHDPVNALDVATKQYVDGKTSNAGIPEAPVDGKYYVRRNGAWEEVPAPAPVPWAFDVNGDVILKYAGTTMVRIKPTGLILTKDDVEVFSVSV